MSRLPSTSARVPVSLVSLALVVAATTAAGPGPSARGAVDSGTPVATARILERAGESARAYRVMASAPEADGEQPEDLRLEARLLTELGRYGEAESLLATATPLVDDAAVYRYALRRALLDVLDGHYSAAIDILAQSDSLSDPVLDPYRDYARVRAYFGAGRIADAVAAGDSARARGVPSALAPDFDEALVQVYQVAGRTDDALALLRGMEATSENRRESAHLLALQYALCVEAGGDCARTAARRMVTEHPVDPETEPVVDDVLANVSPSAMSVGELMDYASWLSAHLRFHDARRLHRELAGRKLNRRQREERRLLLAQHFYLAGEYTRAVSLSKPTYHSPALRRQSTLILARSYRRTNRLRSAARLYEYFARAFPNDGKAAEALYVAAGIYRDLGDHRASERAADRLRRGYPSSYYGHAASLHQARRLETSGRTSRAMAILRRMARRSRWTDESAMYYLARAAQRSHDSERADHLVDELRAVDAFSFYLRPSVPATWKGPLVTGRGEVAMDGEGGLVDFLERAASRKDAAIGRIRREISDDAAPPRDDDGVDAAQHCVARGRWLLEAGFRTWGGRELDAAYRRCSDSRESVLDIAALYDEFAMPWRSVRLYQAVKDAMPWRQRRAFDNDFLWLLYPLPYPVQVLENASRYDMPPHLAYGMIREESRFDRNAVSRVGARGLMQLMPRTARYIAQELDLPEGIDTDLLDPDVNVAFGIWYAASLLEAGNGDALWMLAAYNSGTSNARRWLGHGGENDAAVIDAVDDIDYKETRLYVQRIVEAANVYHSLYFGRGAVVRGDD